ncbi:MAG TPA: hypothetical protein VLK65_23730 [Vicinamibacteria bacterium]|nr:hypothetical protein [Vicinamibacteria bacterium]
MIAEVTSLLAGHLAAGSLLTVALLSLESRLPLGFLRFCTSAAGGVAGLAALLGSGIERWLGAVVLVASLLWWGVLHLEYRPRWMPFAAAGVALAALVSLGARGTGYVHGWLGAFGSLTAGLVLGTATVTMILGHWYLVDTSLSIAPLRSGARWFGIAVALRWLSVGAALPLGGWDALSVHRFADVVFSTTALFFLFRSLTGLGAPLLLSTLVWQTVRIRSTQSATGLLYVAVVLVLFGELISQFLRVTTGFPL